MSSKRHTSCSRHNIDSLTGEAGADSYTEAGVDALLAAAAGSDASEVDSYDKYYVGERDEDLLYLIRNAITLLHNHVVAKNHLQGRVRTVKAAPGRWERPRKGENIPDPERLVITKLEQLLQGGATNIGCIISGERARLIWSLYMQLLYLVTAPHFALPRAFHFLPQASNSVAAPQQGDSPSTASTKRRAQKGPKTQTKVASPHQFRSRQKYSS